MDTPREQKFRTALVNDIISADTLVLAEALADELIGLEKSLAAMTERAEKAEAALHSSIKRAADAEFETDTMLSRALTAEAVLEGARKDAERYRWMRNTATYCKVQWDARPGINGMDEYSWARQGEKMDAYIDAALSAPVQPTDDALRAKAALFEGEKS